VSSLYLCIPILLCFFYPADVRKSSSFDTNFSWYVWDVPSIKLWLCILWSAMPICMPPQSLKCAQKVDPLAESSAVCKRPQLIGAHAYFFPIISRGLDFKFWKRTVSHEVAVELCHGSLPDCLIRLFASFSFLRLKFGLVQLHEFWADLISAREDKSVHPC